MNLTQKSRIQATLLEAARIGRFYPVQMVNGLPVGIDVDSGKVVSPKSSFADEESSQFARDLDYGRSLAMKKTNHTFELILTFDQRVDSSMFEEDRCAAPLKLPPTEHSPAVTIEIRDAEYQHPPTHEPANGSRLKFTFEAVEGRR